MIQKIKQKLITFFKNPKEVISFFLPIIVAIILIIPVNYTITVGGGIINMDKKIDVENEYDGDGSFNAAYVKELNGTVLTYLLSYIIPSYKLNKIEEITLENEEEKDYNFREKMSFNTSLDSAIKVSYTSLNKKIEIVKSQVYVVYIADFAKTSLFVKDEIIKVNDIDVTSVNDIKKILETSNFSDVVITVMRNNEKIKCLTELVDVDGEKKLGVYLMEKYTYETDPKIEFNFSDKEIGPSGGFIMTLSIYNKLVKDDITKGYKISGTGTIDDLGNVGEVGGIYYKLTGSVNKKSDIFFCSMDNYKEAIKIQKEKNYDIKIYGVNTFDEAVEILKKLPKK